MEVRKENPYTLLGRDDPKGKSGVQSAENELNIMVAEIVAEYDRIEQRHPKVGIGDTSTDEAIAHRIYHAIHFREIPEVK